MRLGGATLFFFLTLAAVPAARADEACEDPTTESALDLDAGAVSAVMLGGETLARVREVAPSLRAARANPGSRLACLVVGGAGCEAEEGSPADRAAGSDLSLEGRVTFPVLPVAAPLTVRVAPPVPRLEACEGVRSGIERPPRR